MRQLVLAWSSFDSAVAAGGGAVSPVEEPGGVRALENGRPECSETQCSGNTYFTNSSLTKKHQLDTTGRLWRTTRIGHKGWEFLFLKSGTDATARNVGVLLL